MDRGILVWVYALDQKEEKDDDDEKVGYGIGNNETGKMAVPMVVVVVVVLLLLLLLRAPYFDKEAEERVAKLGGPKGCRKKVQQVHHLRGDSRCR